MREPDSISTDEKDKNVSAQQRAQQTTIENDIRLCQIVDMVGRIASLDFSMPLAISNKNDMIDAISLGLNMLSEELNINVVAKSKLEGANNNLKQFAYSTAHDLKSPLNSMIGLLALLEFSLNTPDKANVKECVLKLKTTINGMKMLIEGILNYSVSGLSGIQKEEINLNGLLQEIIEEEGLSTKTQILIDGTLPHVWFNKVAMIQVFRNLLNNAVKHSDKDDCRVIIEASDFEDHYQINISDNGPGIAVEHHEKIFTLFHQVNSSSQKNGHGIGLATVNRVLQHAGEIIWVDSTPGSGATFSFTIKKEKKYNSATSL